MIEPHVCQAMAEVVGPEFVSDDRTVCECYSRDPHPSITVRKMNKDLTTIPDLVVLPSSTEEVQAVLRIADRYRVNVIPMGSGDNLTGVCIPKMARTMTLDLKRLNKILEVDEENKTIRMQPWVSYARIQATCMKLGLWNGGTPAAPSSNNAISNVLAYGGEYQTALAYGLGIRSVHSLTVVLPNGDVIRTGSHGMSREDPTYWYGPGPDLKGIWEMGAFGGLGVITEVVWKLHSWAGGDWPIEKEYGHPPIPKNHRFYWYRFNKPENCIKAAHALCYAGIGIGCNIPMRSVNAMCGETHLADGFKRYDEGYYENFWIYIITAGYSPRQLDYEEKVLQEIMKENNGEPLDEERRRKMDNYNFDGFRSGNFVRWARQGIYAITAFGRGPVEIMAGVHELQQSIVKQADKPVPSMNSTWPWYYAYDRGYWWVDERDLYGDQLDFARTMLPLVVQVIRSTPDNPSGYWTPNEPHGAWFGPQIGPNFHLMLRDMKKVLDPNDIMNPNTLVFVRPKGKKPAGQKEG